MIGHVSGFLNAASSPLALPSPMLQASDPHIHMYSWLSPVILGIGGTLGQHSMTWQQAYRPCWLYADLVIGFLSCS